MIESTGIWRTESNTLTQTATSVAAVVIGLALAIGFREFEGPGLTGSRAGFLLGIILLALGAAVLLFSGKQVITVEAKSRRIIIEHLNRFRKSKKEIRFDEIADVYLGAVGDREGGRMSHHVVVKLNSGKEIALFKGFFEGSFSRPVMEARCKRLDKILHSSIQPPDPEGGLSRR
jgi:hypothetical protein